MPKRFIAHSRASLSHRLVAPLTILLTLFSASVSAQWPATASVRDDHTGPYNVTILEGGEGLTRPLTVGNASLEANGAWSMTGWVNPRRKQDGAAVLLLVGEGRADARAIFLQGGEFAGLASGKILRSGQQITPGQWTAVAARSFAAVSRSHQANGPP